MTVERQPTNILERRPSRKALHPGDAFALRLPGKTYQGETLVAEMAVASLVRKFYDLSRKWSVARPASKANKLYKEKLAVAREIWNLPEGRVGIEGMLNDDDRGVVISAAAVSLAWESPLGIAALERLSGTEGAHSLSAMMTLQEFRAGRLDPRWWTGLERPANAAKVRAGVPADEDLALADRVYSLAMNGGIEHARDVVGKDFLRAIEIIERVGATEAARALRAGVDALAGKAAGERDAAQLAALEAADHRLSRAEVLAYLSAAWNVGDEGDREGTG